MAISRTHINSSCIKCNSIEKLMIRVGAFVMCRICYLNEFGESYEFSRKSRTYKKWLDIYMNRVYEER
jgi:transcription elongation factor Elf1